MLFPWIMPGTLILAEGGSEGRKQGGELERAAVPVLRLGQLNFKQTIVQLLLLCPE